MSLFTKKIQPGQAGKDIAAYLLVAHDNCISQGSSENDVKEVSILGVLFCEHMAAVEYSPNAASDFCSMLRIGMGEICSDDAVLKERFTAYKPYLDKLIAVKGFIYAGGDSENSLAAVEDVLIGLSETSFDFAAPGRREGLRGGGSAWHQACSTYLTSVSNCYSGYHNRNKVMR